MSCEPTIGRVSAFARSHDRAFLRELAYRMLDSMDDKLKRVFVSDGYDDADWIAAATMLLPLDLAKQISFITYTGSPERCFHKLAGLFDDDDLPPMVAMFAISPGRFEESDRDELFDSYVDGAYEEGSDRQAFFDFLARVGWKDAGKGVIDAYHLFSVCEKGAVPPEGSRLRCLDALRRTLDSARDEDIQAVYGVVKGLMDPGMADFFANEAVPRMKDRKAADRMLAEVSAYTLEPSRGLAGASEVVSSYGRFKDAVLRCVDLDALDLIDFPAARYYCYKAWSESKGPRLAEVVSGYGALDDVFVDAVCLDGTAAAAMSASSPLSEPARGSLKDGFVSRMGGLPAALLTDAFRLGLSEDPALASRLSEGISARADRGPLERSFIDEAIACGDAVSATAIAARHIGSCVEGGGDLAPVVRFIGERASSLDWKCVSGLLSALSGSIDFKGFGPLPAAREALAAFPDMEGMVTSEVSSRIRLLDSADRIAREDLPSGPVDLSSLGKDDAEAFLRLCIGPALPKKGADAWVKDRLELFPGCPDEAARRMGAVVSRSALDRFDAEAVASFISSARSLGASDEAVYGSLSLDARQAGKVRKLLDEGALEGFDQAFKEEEGSRRGLFSKPQGDAAKEAEKQEKQPRKGGLLGFLKR